VRRFVVVLFVLCLGCLLMPSAVAQREKPPTAKEIEAARTKAKLDTANTATHMAKGKKAKVTPTVAPPKATPKSAAAGVVVAEMELEGVKPFPRGIFPVYVRQIGKDWHAYSVVNGKVIPARSVVVKELPKAVSEKPTIEFNFKIVIHWGRMRITIEWV
jgi:hypothetical protein